MIRIGLISDTHNLLRPEAVAALQGCDHIIHAGDICSAAILDKLAALAPLTIVRGNNDQGDWAACLPETALLELDGHRIYVLHDLKQLDLDPAASGIMAVISGHSHKPAIKTMNGVLYINPGSAGPRRFSLPVTVAALDVDGASAQARIIELSVGAGHPVNPVRDTRLGMLSSRAARAPDASPAFSRDAPGAPLSSRPALRAFHSAFP